MQIHSVKKVLIFAHIFISQSVYLCRIACHSMVLVCVSVKAFVSVR